jgi:hypothetical protein
MAFGFGRGEESRGFSGACISASGERPAARFPHLTGLAYPIAPASGFDPERPSAHPSVWLHKHRGKTFIGRVEKGFDLLGYRFGTQGLPGARLYQQDRERPDGLSLRSVVRTALTWLNRNRRLAKDFDTTLAAAEAWLFLAGVQLLIRRLATP